MSGLARDFRFVVGSNVEFSFLVLLNIALDIGLLGCVFSSEGTRDFATSGFFF